MKRALTLEQVTAILSGVMCIALFLVALQLWLLTATVSAQMGNDASVSWPAALASLACCALNVGLFRYLRVVEAPQASGGPEGSLAQSAGEPTASQARSASEPTASGLAGYFPSSSRTPTTMARIGST
jgi:hypothetical protein